MFMCFKFAFNVDAITCCIMTFTLFCKFCNFLYYFEKSPGHNVMELYTTKDFSYLDYLKKMGHLVIHQDYGIFAQFTRKQNRTNCYNTISLDNSHANR